MIEPWVISTAVITVTVIVTGMIVAAQIRSSHRALSESASPLVRVVYVAGSLVVLTYLAISVLDLGTASGRPAEIQLPLLLAGGLVVLLLALVATTLVFGQLQLTDKTEALGLPRDSIRAVIALSLILIFAIISIYIYNRTVVATVDVLEGLTREEVDQIPVGERTFMRSEELPPTPTPPPGVAAAPDTREPTFTVRKVRVFSDAAENLAQQLITTLSTLVVAISAFYFGAKTVGSAAAATGGQPFGIVARPTQGRVRKTDAGWELFDVAVTTEPPGMDIRHEITGDPTGTVERRGESNSYAYRAGSPTFPVTLTFSLGSQPSTSTRVTLDAAAPAAEESAGTSAGPTAGGDSESGRVDDGGQRIATGGT